MAAINIDNRLLENCLSEISEGSTDALGILYKETSTAVYGYALGMLKNRADAEDVVHDCYLAVYRRASQYHRQGKPLAWILTIARNLCLEKLRSSNREQSAELEDWILPDKNADSEITRTLKVCLEILDEEERQIVILHAISGFKHREIASFLHKPLATVLSKYNRSLKKMRSVLREGD